MAADGQTGRDLSRIPDDRADAFDEWMTRFAELDDAAVERLLRGDTPEGCEDLAPVAGVAAALRHEATAHRPAMGTALRAQIVERPHVPPRYAGAPRRRLQLAVAAAAVLIVGVAATQNALPAAAQRAVSNVADLVGLDVPRPDGDADETPGTSSEDTPSGPTDGTEVVDDSEATDGTDGTGGSEAPEPSGAEGGEAGTPGTDAPSSPAGPPDSTPGGATPADPGTPGDDEPATPAVPPPHSNGRGNGNGGESGQANGAADRAQVPSQGQGGGAPADPG